MLQRRAGTQAKVDEICELMRNCEFRTGKTIKELAKKWDLSVSTVKEYSAEASKIVRKELTDPDRVFSIVGPALEEAILDAKKSRDFRQLAQLARVFADITGASAARRVDVGVHQDLNGMTQAQLALEAEKELTKMRGDVPQLGEGDVMDGELVEVEYAESGDE